MAVQSAVESGDASANSTMSAEANADRKSHIPQLTIVLTCVVLLLGIVEGWFERTDFTTDAISYLDISRAIPAKDWKMVFNPLWSVGYPLLLAISRPHFPATASGEWLSIHVVNLVVFLCAWFSFLYLLSSFASFFEGIPRTQAIQRYRFLLLTGTCVFIGIEICIDTVSRVGPDLLVSTLFFLGTAILLRLLRSESRARTIFLGVILGMILGAGYWTKGIFLPLSFILLLVNAAALLWKKRNPTPALVAFVVFAFIAAPYAAGLSWSFGRFTLGESGRLNYAFHVNYLPRWTNWQGGPLGYGVPIHPTHQVMKDPNLFVFGKPYHNTYPPFGNVVYWYVGYRQFWTPKYQAIGIARDIWYLVKILIAQPIFYAVAISAILLLVSADDRKVWLRTAGRLWPFYLSALLAIALYVQVHLEARYLGSFLTTLCMLPFVTTIGLGRMPLIGVRKAVLLIMTAGALLNYAYVDRDVFTNIRHHYTYKDNPEWKLGMGLQRLGLEPGDGLGAVGGPNASCTWAYIAHLRIVAELGGNPYDQHHPAEGMSGNEQQVFWHSSPAMQAKILELFKQAGAVAVIAAGKPADVNQPPGWQQVNGTETWVYRFATSPNPESRIPR
jgi:hypothetical protein